MPLIRIDSRRLFRLVLVASSVVFDAGAWFLATSSLAITLEQTGRTLREVGEVFVLSSALGLVGMIASSPRHLARVAAYLFALDAATLVLETSLHRCELFVDLLLANRLGFGERARA